MLDIVWPTESASLLYCYAFFKERVDAGSQVAAGCGRCHIGGQVPLAQSASSDEKQRIDCLVCHSSSYDTSKREALSQTEQGLVWEQDSSVEAAEAVGEPVGNQACLRCHSYTFSGLVRGTPFSESNDVHCKAGMDCTDCHIVSKHRFAGGATTVDLFVRERRPVTVSCENCHYRGEHSDPMIDHHLQKLSCQACHIPNTCGLTKVLWGPVEGSSLQQERDVPIFNSSTGFYEPYREFTQGFDPSSPDDLTGAVRPVYRWHSDRAYALGWPSGSRFDSDSKLFPFKRVVVGLLFDATWTIADLYERFGPSLSRNGLLRPGGLTQEEQDQLAQEPMPLLLDPAFYARYAGEEQGLCQAVDLGMGRLMNVLAGLGLTSDDEIASLGSTLWSGSFNVSCQRDPNAVPLGGEYFSLNHGVRGAGSALQCADCHKFESPIGFSQLGYTESETSYLESFLNEVPAVMVTTDKSVYDRDELMSVKFASFNYGDSVYADIYLALQMPNGDLLFYPTLSSEPKPAANLLLSSGLIIEEFEIPGSPLPAGALGIGPHCLFCAAVVPGTQYQFLGHISACHFQVQ